MDIYSAVKKNNEVFDILSPVMTLKAIKNKNEIEGSKIAMRKDGVALTKFFMWLEDNIEEGITEYTAGKKLAEFRSEQENYFGDSFGSIVGFKR